MCETNFYDFIQLAHRELEVYDFINFPDIILIFLTTNMFIAQFNIHSVALMRNPRAEDARRS